jgi:hypothetical protein
MLDRRAWLISGLLILIATGVYLLWLYRPKATYNARSLSASHGPANTPSKPATKSLHVEGCKEDFIVSPGELIEPQVIPGASLDQARKMYGPESKRDSAGALTWDKWEYSLTDGYFGSDSPQNFVDVSLNGGHIVETLDGVELGLDSFGTIFRKMRDKKVEVHENIDGPEGRWTYTVSFYSACGHKFRSEYSRTLKGSPEIDKLITPIPLPPGSPAGKTNPWRSDIFMNKVVYEYSLVPANGHDDSPNGSPSQHD